MSQRRRASGLLREEVAQLARISTTWYTWLEQGRQVRVSLHVLRSLARALRLTAAEHDYLLRLARPDMDLRGLTRKGKPGAGLQAVLHGLMPHPAYVLDRYWQIVAWNEAAACLLGGFDQTGLRSNMIGRIFLDPDWRLRFADWTAIARSAAAQFRLAVAGMDNDPVLTAFLANMELESGEFTQLWKTREIAEPPVWTKRIRHPGGGEFRFDYATFRPAGRDGDFLISIYTPADAETATRFADLLAMSASAAVP